VNKVLLLGNATRDAELRHTQSGKAVANLRLATNRTVGGQESSQYHTVVCWDRLAELAALYVKKGQPLFVEGRLDYREYTDGEGQTRRTTEIIASDVQFLGDRSGAPRDEPATEATTAPLEEVSLDDIPL
jgi:single-strand DNA-binding protein